jgi:hypothetical protein
MLKKYTVHKLKKYTKALLHARKEVRLEHKFSNCGVPPGGAVGPLGGASFFFFVWGAYLLWTEYGRKDKLYIFIGTLFGWNMKFSLSYNLNFTKVYINLEKYFIH